MAPAADEFDAILELDARRLAAMDMSAYIMDNRRRCAARCACSTAHTPLFHLTARTRAPQALQGAGGTIRRRGIIPGPVQVRRIPPPAPQTQHPPPIANSSGHTHI